MTSSRVLVASFVVLVALGGAGWTLLRETGVDEPPKPASQPRPQPVNGVAPAKSAAAIEPTKSPTDVSGMVRYPDGTYLPALNGVRGAPAIQWPAGRPFSPVVDKVGTPPNEWYVHADGARSTTTMTFRSDLGRTSPMSHVAVPQKPLPADPEDGVGVKK